MKFRVLITIFITWMLVNAANVQAIPVRLTVQPKDANHLEFTISPVESGAFYEVLARTNGPDGHWMTVGEYIGGSNNTISVACDLSSVPGLALNPLQDWTFVAGKWDDPFGDELPVLYKELVLRTDPYTPGDPYGDPMGDGWDNQQKLQNNMDPYQAYPPPPPQASVSFFQGTNGNRYGHAVVTWRFNGGPVPDYILIERATVSPRPMTNNFRFNRPPGPGAHGRYPTNWASNFPRHNRPNWPPNFRPGYNQPNFQPQETFITGPYAPVAKCRGVPGLKEYRYIDPNVDTLFQPLYRIEPHYSPPLRAHLDRVDASEIRKTIITVAAQPTVDGYALTVPDPIPYARYLLLVRDKNDSQWRASGYFMSGTNRDPVYLHVDKKGMMHDGQGPLSMPEVKYLPNAVEPEFVAGWGDDSDGDGLPDVYEVLVTHTDPDKADTGNTGTLDGYKVMTSDGWDNLEKFRRRADPLRPATPPPTVELIRPTGREILNAATPKSDLNCELQIEIRTNGASSYQPIEQIPWMASRIMNFRQVNARKEFDVRISWKFAEPKPKQYEVFGRGGAPFQALESLREKTSLELAESFKANLETNPPLSPVEASSKMAAIEHAYRQDEMDKGLAMAEMMMISDNQSQDFYGRVIDQYGRPVVGADVNLGITRSTGGDGNAKTQTDADGLFQFTGIRGESLSITPSKAGYQIEGHGLGLEGHNGPETTPDKRRVYAMWKLRGAEPMIHGSIDSRKIDPDGRAFTIDFLKRQITEGTNGSGDIIVQIQRPPNVKPRQKFDWSFTMTAIDGGFIEVTNDDYLNDAPENGYQSQYIMTRHATDVVNYSTWPLYHTDRTFFVKSRGGQVYGHFHISQFDPDYRDKAALGIDFYVNPASSRNLEFDPNKQIEYAQKPQTAVSAPKPIAPMMRRITSSSPGGQVVCWGSMTLPLVNPSTHFIAVAAGGEHSLALKADGTVVAWGRNLSRESTVPAGLSNVIAIAAGGRSNTGFSLALKKDGTVVAWGDNAIRQTSVPVGLSNVVAITAGVDHCLALKKDGTVVGWGFNFDGKAQSPPGLSNVVAISAGEEHNMALKSDGTVVAWGRNQHGQANVPPGLSNVVSICSGSYFNLALKKDGTVVGWGIDMPKDLTDVTAIAAGPWDGMALKGDGTLVVWGQRLFRATQIPSGLTNVATFCGGGNDYGDHNLALLKDGRIVCWGNNNFGQCVSPGSLTGITSIAAGLGHYLAIKSDGTVIAWGGENHQGDGQAWVPAGVEDIRAGAGGWYHSLAVRDDGTVTGWGFGVFGQTSPPNGLSNVVTVTTAYNHSLALKQDGTVVGWGNPYLAQVPPGLSNVVAIAAGTGHNLALKKDGTVLSWGANAAIQTNLPANLTNVTAIAVGGEYSGDHDLALKSDGTVVAWGSNKTGQSNEPAGLTNVIAVSAGANHSLALERDGTVVAWGDNSAGQCNVPQGLTNVIAIAAGGLSSAAIVNQPTASLLSAPPLAIHRVWRLAFLILVLIIVGLFWFVTHRKRNTSAV